MGAACWPVGPRLFHLELAQAGASLLETERCASGMLISFTAISPSNALFMKCSWAGVDLDGSDHNPICSNLAPFSASEVLHEKGKYSKWRGSILGVAQIVYCKWNMTALPLCRVHGVKEVEPPLNWNSWAKAPGKADSPTCPSCPPPISVFIELGFKSMIFHLTWSVLTRNLTAKRLIGAERLVLKVRAFKLHLPTHPLNVIKSATQRSVWKLRSSSPGNIKGLMYCSSSPWDRISLLNIRKFVKTLGWETSTCWFTGTLTGLLVQQDTWPLWMRSQGMSLRMLAWVPSHPLMVEMKTFDGNWKGSKQSVFTLSSKQLLSSSELSIWVSKWSCSLRCQIITLQLALSPSVKRNTQ